MAPQRVLLVEDDRMLRQFVRMALEELDMELLEADSVASAVTQLQNTPVQLILTDLMMPGESGLDLLERLHRQPTLRGGARIVVLSAGVNTDMRIRLQAYEIWRILLKPVSVLELENCVRQALGQHLSAGTNADATGQGQAQPSAPTIGNVPNAATTAREQALATYFGGDAALFNSYLASCMAQFSRDVQMGDLALRTGDLASLRLQAHSLKTVLRTLGLDSGHEAAMLEAACKDGRASEAARLWDALRTLLLSLPPQT